MVLLTSLLAAIAVGGHQNDGSILARLIPVPTGHNGYEEYLHAADIVGTNGWGVYDDWLAYKQASATRKRANPADGDDVPPLPPGVTPDMPDLEVRKIADYHLGITIDIIRQGNEKQVFDPRSDFRYDTLLPELSRFKTLSKIGANKAYVEFADGRSRQAVDDLLEGLKFSWKIFGASRISALVAIATQAVALAEFERHLGQLSLSDAQQVERTCTNLIETSVDATTIYKNERSGTKSALTDLFTKAKEFLTPEDHKAFGAALQGLSTSQRQELQEMVSQSLDQRTLDEEQRVNGPESGWLMRDNSEDPKPMVGDNSVSNLALMVLDDFLPKSMQRTFLKALAKGRIQLRLMRLHAKVLEFHWVNHRWPSTIEEFADAKVAFDPFENGPFHYELQGDGYRLYSLGVPGLGRIELKYRPMATSGSGGNGPPNPLLR